MPEGRLDDEGWRTACGLGLRVLPRAGRHRLEVAVPEVVQISANAESTTATGFRLIGSDIILTPSLSDDGQINMKSVFGFSERRKSKQGLIQVGHRSVPEIESCRTNTEMKLTSGQTIVLGMPISDGTMVVLAVKVTVEE